MPDRKIKKNEVLLWFGSWTSHVGNILFDYANSISIVSAFARKPWVLALYQSSETIIQIVFNLIGGGIIILSLLGILVHNPVPPHTNL